MKPAAPVISKVIGIWFSFTFSSLYILFSIISSVGLVGAQVLQFSVLMCANSFEKHGIIGKACKNMIKRFCVVDMAKAISVMGGF